MTIQEFSNEFDIQYNNISNNKAPNIDLYEKSVYLTRAQLELVKNYFNPKGNKYFEGFENSSKRRYDLVELVKHSNILYTDDIINFTNAFKLNKYSQFFNLPEDVFLIVQEQAYSIDPLLCNKSKDIPKELFDKLSQDINYILNNGNILDIKPITHDEYNIQIKNPFKDPNKTEAWRIDFNHKLKGNQNIEIISKYNLNLYRLRYVKYPRPIILTNLEEDFPSEGLSIDGVSIKSQCELNEGTHSEILNRAVEMAMADYRSKGNMEGRFQINNRNE